MGGFRDSLKQAVRQIAFRTDLNSLKKQGIEQVSVLGMDRIVGLIEEAVHRSLKSRLVGLEREAVADATKAEFLRLLRTNQDLQREKSEVERLKERAEEEVDQMRRQLGVEKQALEQRLQHDSLSSKARYEGEDAKLAERIRELMAASGAGTGDALQEGVLDLVLQTVGKERRAAEQARSALRDREVDNLQRRIEKLTNSLETTEHRLRQVAAMKNIDDGISSIYREVQGLEGGSEQFGKKKELMSAIFAANLRLQKKTDSTNGN
ncbi:MAG: hypothetical protein ABL997_12305 [Planctomycetota bacterium]